MQRHVALEPERQLPATADALPPAHSSIQVLPRPTGCLDGTALNVQLSLLPAVLGDAHVTLMPWALVQIMLPWLWPEVQSWPDCVTQAHVA
jgi:hypothetical protein